MRFPKETLAAIYEAAPKAVTIAWPAGSKPKKGRVYWLQSEEDAKEAEKKADNRREHFAETCAEVLAGMHRRRYKKDPDGYKPKRRSQSTPRPNAAADDRILVIDSTDLDPGWEAKVALHEVPDPVQHSGIKAKVPAGPSPLDGIHDPTEFEPERLHPIPTRQERLEAEDALRLEHKASVDQAEIAKAERRLADQRRKGKTGRLQQAAIERSRRRSEESAESTV